MGVIGRLLRLGVGLVVIVLALTIAAVLYVSDRNLRLHGEGRSLEAPVDAVVVLGGGVDPDGVLRYSSRRRVAGGVSLLEAGLADRLILSGGPVHIPGIPPGGRLMRRHAAALGASPESLVTERRSGSTFENLRFSLKIADEMELERLAILTDAFHLERARWLAAYFGHDDPGLVAVPGMEKEGWHERTWYIVREAMAWWYNLAKVAGWEILAAAGLDAEEREAWVR